MQTGLQASHALTDSFMPLIVGIKRFTNNKVLASTYVVSIFFLLIISCFSFIN